MKLRLVIFLTSQSMAFQTLAQNRFVATTYKHILPPEAQFDSLLAEYGAGFDADRYGAVFYFWGKLGRNVRFVSRLYRTQDPDGKEVLASGLLAYPEKDRTPFLGCTNYKADKSGCNRRINLTYYENMLKRGEIEL